LRQRAFGALGFGDLFSDEFGEFAIGLLLVRTVADAADEKIRALADEELVGLAPLHEFQVVNFHGWTSRMAALMSFS
jgi:hypothetical protein